jgi:N-acyl amino acid synthase of PEP-CTERM/exosortase system
MASTKPISRISPFPRTENSTSELFNRYLSVVPADTPSLLDQAFRLRFQVYCVERGFESPSDHPDSRERDRDDDRSLHSLLIDRATGLPVGTVGLILPDRGNELPVFGIVRARERSATVLPEETTAEVSRFAVAKSFRRRIEHGWRSSSGCTAVPGSVRTDLVQLLTFGLIRAVVMMSALGGITHIVGMMEPALLRLLTRLGIAFHPLGGLVEHHGIRQPGWAVMRQPIESIENYHPELGEIIRVPEDGRKKSLTWRAPNTGAPI